MPNTYTEKVMVASGVPFTPDEEHPYPPNPEEVEFETIPSGGGGGTDLDSLDFSTDETADADLFVTKEDGRTEWVKKSFLKIWNYISSKLGIFIGTTATWEAKTTEEKDAYNLIFITDDNINSQTSYDIPHNQTNVGHTLDLSLNDFTTVTEQTTALDDGTTATLKTYWQTAPTASNDIYGVSVYGGKLWRVHNELGTYSARRYDYDSTYNGATLYTNSAKTGSGTTVTKTISAGTSMDNAIGTLLNNDSALSSALSDVNNELDIINPSNQAWVKNVDLNNYKTTGIYSLSTNLTNTPSNAVWLILIVIAPRVDTVVQLISASSHPFYREYRNGTWSQWAQLDN